MTLNGGNQSLQLPGFSLAGLAPSTLSPFLAPLVVLTLMGWNLGSSMAGLAPLQARAAQGVWLRGGSWFDVAPLWQASRPCQVISLGMVLAGEFGLDFPSFFGVGWVAGPDYSSRQAPTPLNVRLARHMR